MFRHLNNAIRTSLRDLYESIISVEELREEYIQGRNAQLAEALISFKIPTLIRQAMSVHHDIELNATEGIIELTTDNVPESEDASIAISTIMKIAMEAQRDLNQLLPLVSIDRQTIGHLSLLEESLFIKAEGLHHTPSRETIKKFMSYNSGAIAIYAEQLFILQLEADKLSDKMLTSMQNGPLSKISHSSQPSSNTLVINPGGGARAKVTTTSHAPQSGGSSPPSSAINTGARAKALTTTAGTGKVDKPNKDIVRDNIFERMEKNLFQLKTDYQDLQKQLAYKEDEVKNLRGENASLKNDLKNTTQELADLRTKIDATKQRANHIDRGRIHNHQNSGRTQLGDNGLTDQAGSPTQQNINSGKHTYDNTAPSTIVSAAKTTEANPETKRMQK